MTCAADAMAQQIDESASHTPASSFPAPHDGETLYLEVILNHLPRPGLLRVIRHEDRVFASGADLAAIGLAVPAADAEGLVALDAIPGAVVQYDRVRQRLQIDVPLDVLTTRTTRLGGIGTPQLPAAAHTDPGAVLNYDLYASTGMGRQLSLGTDLRVFGIAGAVIGNTAITSAHHDGDGGDWRGRSVRLDTQARWSFPTHAVEAIAGDTVTGLLGWTRAVRIGGLQVSRNFALQPYRTTMPLPAFAGDAIVPSMVDLYVDGVRQSSHPVPPGPFQVTTVPGISGAGLAQLVVTDSFGRTRTLDFPFYATQQLLAAGLSDWSASLGVVREDYGVRSFSYSGEPMVSGQLRHGVSDRFTLEAHMEAGDGLWLAGLGGAWLLGRAGVLGASQARSSAGGTQRGVSYHWTDGRFTLALDSLRTRRDYRDVASRYGPLPPRTSERALFGYSHARLGSISLTYVRLNHHDDETGGVRLLGAFWTRSFRDWSLHLSANHDRAGHGHDSVHLGVVVPLGRQRQLGASWQRSGDRSDAILDVLQPLPIDGGLGWRLQARAGNHQGGTAEVGWMGDRGRLTAGASRFAGDSRAYAQLDGSMVWMAGRAFLARDVNDGFAVVSTAGVPGVPVLRENRIVGRSGGDGLLLVTGLNAWQHNKLSIDPMDLPADLRVLDAEVLATPSDRAGTLVHFPIRPVRAAILVLHDAEGRPLALGSRVRVEDIPGAHAFVGHDGETYLESLDPRTQLRVEHDAGTCFVQVEYPPDASGAIPRIGPLACLQEPAP